MNGEMVSSSPCTTPRKLKFEQLRADYELFLQTFESMYHSILQAILMF